MYKPKAFTEDRQEVLLEHILKYPLGTLISQDDSGITANLIPFSLHLDEERPVLRCHLARANPQIESLQNGREVLVIFNGPQNYISPNLYPTKKADGKAVPTWNYSTVQVRGTPVVMEDPKWILQQITDLTKAQEKDSEHPWQVSDAPQTYILGQLKAIIGFEIPIEKIDGKFKVSQNQPEINRVSLERHFRQIGETQMADFISQRGPRKPEEPA